MRIALLGATSQIAKDLLQSFAANSRHDLVLFARRPEAVVQWLGSVGLLLKNPAQPALPIHQIATEQGLLL